MLDQIFERHFCITLLILEGCLYLQQFAVASIWNHVTKEHHVVTLLECLPCGALFVKVLLSKLSFCG